MTDQGISALWIHAENKVTPASPQHNTLNGGTFAGTHGWYGAPRFDNGTTELISDHSTTALFIRKENNITPANPLHNTTNGGTFANTHGWYGNLQPSGDATSDHGNTFTFGFVSTVVSFNNYIMQAYESGGGCSGNVRRVWLAIGAQPDLIGAQYTGPRCSPPGIFSNFSILAIW
jgi:hypothetical protein